MMIMEREGSGNWRARGGGDVVVGMSGHLVNDHKTRQWVLESQRRNGMHWSGCLDIWLMSSSGLLGSTKHPGKGARGLERMRNSSCFLSL